MTDLRKQLIALAKAAGDHGVAAHFASAGYVSRQALQARINYYRSH